MIGHFRHEAMNQATVIAGFCVLINHELEKAPYSANAKFAQAMKSITQLLDVFTSRLNAFRNECSIKGLSPQQLENLNPSTDLNPYFTNDCGEQFSSLAAMADNISATAGSIIKADILDDKLYQRFQYIKESAAKLNKLFTNPVSHMQRMMKVHTRDL